MVFAAKDLNISRNKVFFGAGVYVYELLGVTIYQREPGALYLHHYAMAFFKYVRHIGDGVFDLGDLFRFKSLRGFEAIAEATAHYFATHQHLVAANRVVFTIAFAIYGGIVGEIIRENIDELYYKIGIGGGNGGIEVCNYGAGKGNIFGQGICFVYQHIGAAGGKTLVVIHILAGANEVHAIGIGYGFCGIAGVFVIYIFAGSGGAKHIECAIAMQVEGGIYSA